MRNAIITGGNGQDGHYLAELLRHYQVEPVLVNRGSGIDLGSASVVSGLVESVRPEFIFHLAANSTVDHLAALANHDTIASGSLNILEAVKRHAPECRVFLAGSAYQFLNVGNPIKETDPWDTESVYCAARGYSNLLARAYRSMGLSVYFGYFFHHDSPRRGLRHLSGQIANAAKSKLPITIGDISVVKEWTWAGDSMEAVWSLVNQDTIWEANIGTGIGRTVAEFCEACYLSMGLRWQDFVRSNNDFTPKFQRLTCDPERIYSTGWRPRYDMEYLASAMVSQNL